MSWREEHRKLCLQSDIINRAGKVIGLWDDISAYVITRHHLNAFILVGAISTCLFLSLFLLNSFSLSVSGMLQVCSNDLNTALTSDVQYIKGMHASQMVKSKPRGYKKSQE